jgi:hypothetical protein
VLLRFRATNYASIRDEQELSLIALDDHPDLATSAAPLSKDRVLPAAGIFGPNASGKSNVVKAMGFAQSVVVESHQYWLPEEAIPRWPFRLDTDGRIAPSAFVFDGVRPESNRAKSHDRGACAREQPVPFCGSGQQPPAAAICGGLVQLMATSVNRWFRPCSQPNA